LCFILSFEQAGLAQGISQADFSASFGKFLSSCRPVISQPSYLRYISYDKIGQSFKVLLNKEGLKEKNETKTLDSLRQALKFFYIGLAIPNEDFWVNLRPDSSEKIIDDDLTRTDLGKVLLEADLELKKDLARSTFPSTPEGKEYWEKIYRKIEEVYGFKNPQISLNTRIWITPGEVIVCEDSNSAYIYKAGLNVSTEAAYLKDKSVYKSGDEQARIINEYSSQLMQKLILPKIVKEVNTGAKYASLRQVYYSLILAQWFKRKFYGAGGIYPYLINRKNLNGLTSSQPWSKDTYFREYQRSFREKEYDLEIRVFNSSGRSVRTYSNGGVDLTGIFMGLNSPRIHIIASPSVYLPSGGNAELFKVDQHPVSVKEPYFSDNSSLVPIKEPALGPDSAVVSEGHFSAEPERIIISGEKKDKISQEQIDFLIELLKSSPKKYLQRLFVSRRINIKERIKFIANELGFDILSGQGSSLLTRRIETLSKNKEFLEGLGLSASVSNLRSSRRYFVAREFRQIVKNAQWEQLSAEEKLAVASYLFDLYGLRSSWMSRGKDWKYFLKWFNLPDTYVDYSFRLIDFIQQYELARFTKSGNLPQVKNRISRLKEIIETMGLEVGGFLDTKITKEGVEVYVLKTDRDKDVPEEFQPVKNSSGLASVDSILPEVRRLDRDAPEELPVMLNYNDREELGPVDELLRELETSIDVDLTDAQLQAVLSALINHNPGDDQYERARQILRHIHPDEFKKLRRIVSESDLFSGNQRLRERFSLIALERPSDLSVGLVRSMSKIHDWEEVLNKKETLTVDDLAKVLACCERIVDLLPLRLTQETNDSIGSIYRVVKQVHGLIDKTINRLINQKITDKTAYAGSVTQLLKRGHYFSDYFGALSYLLAMNIPKGYILKLDKNNGNHQNGKSATKVKYSFWHKLTAVPAMERNAVSNLNSLLPLLNSEGNEFTPKEHYLFLKPTRIGPSDSWALRKPVSIICSLLLGAFSIFTLIVNGSFSLGSLLSSSIGALTIPVMHYGFAIIGWISTKREINQFHQRIKTLEKKWDTYLFSDDNSGKRELSAEPSVMNKTFIPEEVSENEFPEEDIDPGQSKITLEDVKALKELAEALKIEPVELPQLSGKIKELFGPGKAIPPVIIMPDALMFTRSSYKIKHPVRLGNQIFVADSYFSSLGDDYSALLTGTYYEDLKPEKGLGNYRPEESPGGIDLRLINYQSRNIPVSRGVGNELSPRDQLLDLSVKQEIIQINRLLKAKIIPSGERLSECISKIPVSARRNYAGLINNCLAEIFMLQEEYGQPSEPYFVELLGTVVSSN